MARSNRRGAQPSTQGGAALPDVPATETPEPTDVAPVDVDPPEADGEPEVVDAGEETATPEDTEPPAEDRPALAQELPEEEPVVDPAPVVEALPEDPEATPESAPDAELDAEASGEPEPPVRPGRVRCQVAARVHAEGYGLDGHWREAWEPGAVGDFLRADVASVDGALVPMT
jgi:hypothetical protein